MPVNKNEQKRTCGSTRNNCLLAIDLAGLAALAHTYSTAVVAVFDAWRVVLWQLAAATTVR